MKRHNIAIQITIQKVVKNKTIHTPSAADLKKWAELVLTHENKAGTMTIRIVDTSESEQLNATYRGKKAPTNVLSFPFENIETFTLPGNIIGDLVLCAPLIEQEALTQGKSLSAHWAHLIIHGTLHLMGYNHMISKEANAMEALEIQLLARLGYSNPYGKSL